MKAREVKRQKLVNRYAEKRAALKAAGDQEGLSKLPRNSNPIRLHNRCMITGRPKGYMRQFGISRIHPRSEKGFLVRTASPAVGFFPAGRGWNAYRGADFRRQKEAADSGIMHFLAAGQ